MLFIDGNIYKSVNRLHNFNLEIIIDYLHSIVFVQNTYNSVNMVYIYTTFLIG